MVECYSIYGLAIESELDFPHWPRAIVAQQLARPDVEIKFGTISEDWDQRTPAGQWYVVDQDQVFVRIDNVGRFLISEGKAVVYQPCGENSGDAWLYVEGVITGAILHQRRIWPLHGSAVLNPSGCVTTFIGQRGIGKSTLLYELQNRNHPVVADDIVAITFDDGGLPWVHPGFPQGKLCIDAAENFGLDLSKLRPIQNPARDKLEKVAVKFEKEFVQIPRQLTEVYSLERGEGKDLVCTELTGLEKLRQLSDNTYRLELLSRAEDYQRLFINILSASNQLRIFRLSRPAEGNSVQELASFVENRWKKQA